MKGGNGYNFAWKDYDKDGIIDATIIAIGDPTNIDTKIIQETASIIIPRWPRDSQHRSYTV
jgi:hypothetical protein